jgi:hypothetical protein
MSISFQSILGKEALIVSSPVAKKGCALSDGEKGGKKNKED